MAGLIPFRSTGLWRPRDLMNIRDEIDKVFEDFFDWKKESGELSHSDWRPSVDISETSENIVVNAEMPGVNKEDIKLTVHENYLTIKGEKKKEEEKKGENFHRVERSYGSFERSFTLPASVDTEKIEAKYKDGVLKVIIPKAEEAKPKEIGIKVE